MNTKNLRKALEEMYDFIAGMPSSLDGFESDFNAAFSELEELESKNIVKVIPCKDCLYFHRRGCPLQDSGYFKSGEIIPFENDFCSYGKPKEGKQ